jgi:PPOX class probable F420-dependent enzyme
MQLADARYCNLATFRRSGVAVETPVWFAAAPSVGDSIYYVFSAGDAGKVKRIRGDARVRVAPCDVRGKVLGDWEDGRARLVTDPAEQTRGYAALRARYGWQMRIGDFFATLTGRYHRRALIAFVLEART